MMSMTYPFALMDIDRENEVRDLFCPMRVPLYIVSVLPREIEIRPLRCLTSGMYPCRPFALLLFVLVVVHNRDAGIESYPLGMCLP